jgi:hypothetical protein
MLCESCNEIAIINQINKKFPLCTSYPSVLAVSTTEAGVTAQMIAVCALPPSDDCSILVSLLSRKFTCCLQHNQSV